MFHRRAIQDPDRKNVFLESPSLPLTFLAILHRIVPCPRMASNAIFKIGREKSISGAAREVSIRLFHCAERKSPSSNVRAPHCHRQANWGDAAQAHRARRSDPPRPVTLLDTAGGAGFTTDMDAGELSETARMARLNLSEEERERLRAAVEQMLAYFAT